MFVSIQTFERVVMLVSDLADLDEQDDVVKVALPALAAIVGCDHITYNEVDHLHGRVNFVEWPDHSIDPASRPVFPRLVGQHPLAGQFRNSGDRSPPVISDLISTADFHGLGLYAEFFSKTPVQHQLSINLIDSSSSVVGIAFNRSRGAFSNAERDILQLMRKPLLAALLRPRLRRSGLSRLVGSAAMALPTLTPREAEVLRLVAAGKTNIAIAHVLQVSPRTVAKHLEHIYRKLEVGGRVQAVTRLPLLTQRSN